MASKRRRVSEGTGRPVQPDPPTSPELQKIQRELEALRAENKRYVERLTRQIEEGYKTHGIIFTSTAQGKSTMIKALKQEVTDKVKERNRIKKELK